MSDEVRLAVQRALDKLINRFGNTSDVIGELRGALAAMDKQEAKQVREPVAVETESIPPVVEEVSTAATEEAKPSPKARKGTGRKK